MPDCHTLSLALGEGILRLRTQGFDTPDLDAKLLLKHAAGFSSVDMITKANEPLDEDTITRFFTYLDRRVNCEPVHRILGYREFFGRSFFISEETLVPRPDTETLVEEALKQKPETVLEIGTGSGVIAVTLAAELPSVRIVATDISDEALQTGRKNAQTCNVVKRIGFRKANLFEGITGSFDMIISNPPYVRSADINELQPEVKLHEPRAALDGGIDGLDFYRAIFEQGINHLNIAGHILVEIGKGQGPDVTNIAKNSGFSRVSGINDLNGTERVIVAGPNA